MLYFILKILLRLAIRVYFRNIHIRNLKHIPNNEPLLVLTNHQSAFMDPIVIGVLMQRSLFYLARGESFNGRVARFIFKRLHMIPIYRQSTTPELMHKNKEVFQACYNHLKNNGAILIFPEGTSKTEPRLRKIKTGAARIALGAEAADNYELGVKFIPVGLNYSNPHQFQTKLFLNFGKPIGLELFFEEFKQDEFKAVNQLTEHIRQKLEEHIVIVENEELDELIKQIELIYKSKIAHELELDKSQQVWEYLILRDITKMVSFFHKHDLDRVIAFQKKIQTYFNKLSAYDLPVDIFATQRNKQGFIGRGINTIIYLILGLPFYLYGAINNYLPYRLPGIFADKLSRKKDFRGSLVLSFGLLTFPLFYLLQSILIQRFLGGIFGTPVLDNWLWLFYLLSLPFTGFFALRYKERLSKIIHNWKLISLFFTKRRLVSEVIREREELLESLEKGRADYLHQVKT